jgi:hypothetical protein
LIWRRRICSTRRLSAGTACTLPLQRGREEGGRAGGRERERERERLVFG